MADYGRMPNQKFDLESPASQREDVEPIRLSGAELT